MLSLYRDKGISGFRPDARDNRLTILIRGLFDARSYPAQRTTLGEYDSPASDKENPAEPMSVSDADITKETAVL